MGTEERKTKKVGQLDLTSGVQRAIRVGQKLRPVFMIGTALLIITQTVALSPKSLDQSDRSDLELSPVELITGHQAVLATGIPKDKIADYTIEGFKYSASQGSSRQWRLNAIRAFLYDEEKLVHAIDIRAQLFDANGRITHVTGKEAKYFLNGRDLEIFGEVVATFPDGFVTRSPYLRYVGSKRRVEIPVPMPVIGDGKATETSEKLDFTAQGLSYSAETMKLELLKDVKVTLTSRRRKTNNVTMIESDRCEILRDTQKGFFFMNPERPAKDRYVKISEPTLFARARKAQLDYGDYRKTVNYLVINEDVLLREIVDGKASLRYATGGRAEFDNEKNQVRLGEFPQIYEDNDTITGDYILFNRDTDIVEVEHGNAYSEGSMMKSQPKKE
ncbi:MAG: LPS export ABC transporter periplasmic protein LptC [Bdellovibrionales bacterium]|nr:LPS export ABC transporter periplasmic protein LptC [Bdellovibrionales bacterium]